jgi:hypothetical protein
MYDFEARRREREEAQAREERANMEEQKRLEEGARLLSEKIEARFRVKISDYFVVNYHHNVVTLIKGRKILVITLKADGAYQLARSEERLSADPTIRQREESLQKADMMDFVENWCMKYVFP